MTPANTNTPLNFGGKLAIIRASAKNNADGISIVEHLMEQGAATPLHIHVTQDEVFHILRGRMRFEVGGKTIIGEAGDILTAPKGVPHRFIVESSDGAHALTILKGVDFENFVRQSSTPLPKSYALPLPEPTEQDIARLMKAAANNHVDLIGPPLAA